MVVRGRNDGHVLLLAQIAEKFDDGNGGVRIEISRGLVGEDEHGVVGQGAGDGHALLLAAGELAGKVVHSVPEAHALEVFLRFAMASARKDEERAMVKV